MKLPHPLLLDDLCREYRRTHTRDDLLSWWLNAPRHWDLLPQYSEENEPAEVTAARALWVRMHLDSDGQRRTEFGAGCWALVEPYTKTRDRCRALERGILNK